MCVCGRWSLMSALHTLLVVLTSVIHLLSGQQGSRPPRSPTTFCSITRHSGRVLKMYKCVLIVNEHTDWKWHLHLGHTGENINVWLQQIQQILSLRLFWPNVSQFKAGYLDVFPQFSFYYNHSALSASYLQRENIQQSPHNGNVGAIILVW